MKKKTRKKTAGNNAQAPKIKDNFLRNMAAGFLILVILDFTAIMLSMKQNTAPQKPPASAADVKSEKMAAFPEELKFQLYYDGVIGPATGMHSLKVCCPGGLAKEYYTYKMPWELILYKFSASVATVALFEKNEEKKEGKIKILILDPDAGATDIKQSDIMMFIKKTSDYMPGYTWQADVFTEAF
ncbi:MAG TPA: hypothetical protein PKJ42_00370 [Candidatus Goldiibacteriota bacterium]|nr:hypothetical protein [Candidatus Goldiibacteriota bacterium]